VSDSSIHNPHDRFVRHFLGDQENARDFAKNFLPAKLQELLVLDELKVDSTNYVDGQLDEHQTDVLFSVPLRIGGRGFIYVLVEHKSYSEARVGLQLLRYMVRIWEKSDRSGPLPLIFPLVLHHGEKSWGVSPRFRDLFESPESFGPYLVDFEYRLVDLCRESEDALKGHGRYLAQLSLMKYFFRRDLPELLNSIVSHLKDLENTGEIIAALEPMIRYLSVQKQVDDHNVVDVLREVFADKGEDVVVTFITKAEEKGRAEGEANLLRSLVRKGRMTMEEALAELIEVAESTDELNRALDILKRN
jgi:hypothetical protein